MLCERQLTKLHIDGALHTMGVIDTPGTTRQWPTSVVQDAMNKPLESSKVKPWRDGNAGKKEKTENHDPIPEKNTGGHADARKKANPGVDAATEQLDGLRAKQGRARAAGVGESTLNQDQKSADQVKNEMKGIGSAADAVQDPDIEHMQEDDGSQPTTEPTPEAE